MPPVGKRQLARATYVAILAASLAAFVPVFTHAQAEGTAATRAELEQQLRGIEQQIATYEQQLVTIKGQKNTLANKIKQLKKQQATLNLQIKVTNLKLASLQGQLAKTQEVIRQHDARLQTLRRQVADYVRLVNQRDGVPPIYRFLVGGTLSEALSDYAAYLEILNGMNELAGEVKQLKLEREQQAEALADQQEQSQHLLSLKLLQQQALTGSVGQQQTLLTQTKGRESTYQQALKLTKQQAAKIRSRIYQLLGVATQITFGQALEIASWVSQQTGVRPAFLLAILTQESNLGKNVGTCNRPGDPPEKSWKVIMKPGRDQEPFRTITGELGMNPDVTPVSCPMRDRNGKQLGWGGAMGPAQFIPSTWMGYRVRVSQLTGKATTNPWDIRDAFVAAAILLRASGADGTAQGEWNAAMRYFSGGTNPAYRFYADNVGALAEKYQADIEALAR